MLFQEEFGEAVSRQVLHVKRSEFESGVPDFFGFVCSLAKCIYMHTRHSFFGARFALRVDIVCFFVVSDFLYFCKA